MNVVEIENVSKSFGSHMAVRNLSLAVPKSSIYGFIGPNGSGKTTTLRMIMRIFHPNAGSGHIRVLGTETFEAANDRVGYPPEERGLYKKMRVGDLLRFFAELKGRRDFKDLVDRWLERMKLSDWKEKKVETLSKGMAQKVQFIAAVIAEPELVVLDEPFSGLDPVNLELLRSTVVDLRRQGTTVIFSTHDMAQAEKMCDFIFMIYQGNKVLDGTLDSIQSRYGQDTIRVRLDRPDYDLSSVAGVSRVVDQGRYRELRIAEDADSQQVLASLMKLGNIELFEVARPSLHDIFVRIAGADAVSETPEEEPVHA